MLPESEGCKVGKKGEEWLTSAEVRKVLRMSTCDLAHLREGGTSGPRGGECVLLRWRGCRGAAREEANERGGVLQVGHRS